MTNVLIEAINWLMSIKERSSPKQTRVFYDEDGREISEEDALFIQQFWQNEKLIRERGYDLRMMFGIPKSQESNFELLRKSDPAYASYLQCSGYNDETIQRLIAQRLKKVE